MASDITIEYTIWNKAGFRHIVSADSDIDDHTELYYQEVPFGGKDSQRKLLTTLSPEDLESLVQVLQARLAQIKAMPGGPE